MCLGYSWFFSIEEQSYKDRLQIGRQSLKYITRSFPGGSNGKEFAYSAEDPGSIPGMGRSLGEGNGNPFQYFLPGVFHRQQSLVGYSPWDHKESNTTERLTLISFSLFYFFLIFFVCDKNNILLYVHSSFQTLHLCKSKLYIQSRNQNLNKERKIKILV